MMNKTSNFAFFSVMLLPAILLLFQNCSELISSDSNLSSLSDLNSNSLPPMLLESSQSLGFSTQATCQNMAREEAFINKDRHMCFVVTNECEASLMEEKGFVLDEEDLCSFSVDQSNFNQDLLQSVTPAELGFETSDELICSQQYMQLINLEKGLCSEARNGCQLSFLESMGFSADSLNLCAQ